MRYPLKHLGSIWYHSEPSDIPYSPNQFLGWDFFAASYSKTALVKITFFFLRIEDTNFVCEFRFETS